jgi:hypothetical protein
MELEASYPVVVTDKLTECRDFYTPVSDSESCSKPRGSSI